MEGNRDTDFVTPLLTVGDSNTSSPHGHSNAFHVVSQTQGDLDASQTSPDFNELDNEESPIAAVNEGTEHDNITTQVNTVFDDSTDDYLAAELKSILNHRYLSGILELKVAYSNGEIEWHPISLRMMMHMPLLLI